MGCKIVIVYPISKNFGVINPKKNGVKTHEISVDLVGPLRNSSISFVKEDDEWVEGMGYLDFTGISETERDVLEEEMESWGNLGQNAGLQKLLNLAMERGL